jgi:hypothetical protein
LVSTLGEFALRHGFNIFASRFEVDDAMADWTYKSVSGNYMGEIPLETNISCCRISSTLSIAEISVLVSVIGNISFRKCFGRSYLMLSVEDIADTGPTNSCTIPGGYVELCEADMSMHCDDGTMKVDNPLKVCADNVRASLVKMERICPDLEMLENLLKKAGFEDIKTMTAKEPFGPWAKDPRMKKIGAMQLLHCESVFESYGMAAFTRVLGMDFAEAKAICDAAKLAAKNKNYHIYGL